MPYEAASDPKFEIGHVLFIDIVGFSKLLINEQSELVRTLNEVVRGAEQVRAAEADGKLVRLPTGDGMALVFRNTPEAPAECALEISRVLKNYPELRVRMGIHSGPVNEVVDVNERANVAGAGMNMAQRVMDCGNAGHILLSKRAADDLAQYRKWQPHLHDLGEYEVKHGAKIDIVNLYTNELGNPETPQKLKGKKRVETYPATDDMRRFNRRPLVVAVIALIAFAAAAFFFFHRSGSAGSGVAATAAATEKSIAVLPFVDLSQAKDQEYFCDGISEEILDALARIEGLRVVARTSSFSFKGKNADVSEIAQKLNVRNVLEGSLRRDGNRIRITAQLVSATNGFHLWSETYERELQGVFAVQDEITRAIVDALKIKLAIAPAAQPQRNSEAYELYLKGRFFWNKRTGNDLKKSIDYFNQAIAKDPGYALAYAGLADAYALLSVYAVAPPRDAFPKAKAAAQKALELDNRLAEAHTSLAEALASYDFDFPQAIAEFKRAIELNPNYATAHHWYGNSVLMVLGRFDEAIAEVKRSVELDPLSIINNADLGQTYYMAHRYDEAVDQLRKAVEIEPGFYYAHSDLGQALQVKGDLAGAIAEYQKARELNDDPFPLGQLGNAYAVSGKTAEALKILDQLEQISKQRYVAAYSFALVHLGLGHKDEALRWLEKSYEDRAAYDVLSIPHDPLLDPLHGDPRFEALVEKIVPRGAK